jgi:hypothetical protein
MAAQTSEGFGFPGRTCDIGYAIGRRCGFGLGFRKLHLQIAFALNAVWPTDADISDRSSPIDVAD